MILWFYETRTKTIIFFKMMGKGIETAFSSKGMFQKEKYVPWNSL